MYPHTYYMYPKNQNNRRTFSFDFVSKTKTYSNPYFSLPHYKWSFPLTTYLPHNVPYLPSKNHLNRRTFSFDFCHENEKHQKSRKISPLFLLTPVHFHFSEVKRSILEKVIFRRKGKMTFSDLKNENFQIWKDEPPFLSHNQGHKNKLEVMYI